MGNILTAGLFRQMLRSATPVALAALGGSMTEHAGIMNIGMDGMILIGAFTAVAVSIATGSAFLGTLAAILVGILLGLFFALFVVKFKSDEFIIGTALNIFAGGLTTFLLWACAQSSTTASTPSAASAATRTSASGVMPTPAATRSLPLASLQAMGLSLALVMSL